MMEVQCGQFNSIQRTTCYHVDFEYIDFTHMYFVDNKNLSINFYTQYQDSIQVLKYT